MIDQFEKWLCLRGKSSNTAVVYGRAISLYLNSEFSKREESLSDKLAMWINSTRKKHSASTITVRLSAARSYCEFSDQDNGVLAKYSAPPARSPEPHPLPSGMSAARAMIAAASTPEARAVVALQALAGLRVSEAIQLTRDDVVSRASETVLKIRGKGEKVRTVPVSRELQLELDRMPNYGKLAPLSNSGARTAVRRAAEIANVNGHNGKGVSSHDLRATFATEVHGGTGDVVLAQRLLGHSSIQTTQGYIGTSMEKLAAAVDFSEKG